MDTPYQREQAIPAELGLDQAPDDVDTAKREARAAVWANSPSAASRADSVLARLPELVELWDLYPDSAAPVGQASALVEFSNAMTHLRWDYDGDLTDGDDE